EPSFLMTLPQLTELLGPCDSSSRNNDVQTLHYHLGWVKGAGHTLGVRILNGRVMGHYLLSVDP
ncbi:MAG: hypothetical protein QF886_24205, partial [Planctomycetota bacterium]|nr:hypothetical protein [Planctomycetota bacterium]